MEPATNKGQLLTPFQRKHLQKSLQSDLSKPYRQRIQIILLADEGFSQVRICQTLGCSPATTRYWIQTASAGMAHLWQDSPIGRPPKVNDEYLERLKQLVNGSPRLYGYSIGRWKADWLGEQLAKELGVEITSQHINRLLKQMGLSTRPKPTNSKNTNSLNVAGKHILIADIQPESIPDSPSFLSINLINLGKH